MSNPKKTTLTAAEESFLAEAVRFFENPGIFIRGVNILALPIDKAQKALPVKVQDRIQKVVEVSLQKALTVSLKTIQTPSANQSLQKADDSSTGSGHLHSFSTGVTGAIGGLFGAPALLVELPVSTVLMLRSIARIAQEFGEDLSKPEGALECLVVFCLGGPSASDDTSDTAYYATRLAISTAVREAALFISRTQTSQILAALESGTAPQLVKFIAQVASFLQVRITKKLLAQIAPVIGAFGGATVNVAFTHFFNQAAKYHFGIRKLEREYGETTIQSHFRRLAKK